MKRVIFVLLVLFAAGCIQPVEEIGCCLKGNISDGCLLYNTTSYTEQPEYLEHTNGLCNDSASGTQDHCNVTIGDRTYLVPICTEDQLVSCVEPDCTAMVCGDFKYQPRVAPSFTSIDDSAGDIPPEDEEEAALNFYKAQCRFLPLDARLRQIMKNSKSQINVFRMGVGSSFDEFEQYRYYFPMSDRFCNINPASSPDETRVDRYMNYLTPDSTEYDPEDMESNCFDESDAPDPFGFEEDDEERDSTIRGIQINFDTIIPDESNYKFSYYGRADYWSQYHDDYYIYSDRLTGDEDDFSVYKQLDAEYYRKELSIAHADAIYGVSNADTTRAPFECDISARECYSGNCDVTTYSRSVMIDEGGGEVVTDCNQATDEMGNQIIYCAPTTDVDVNDGEAPDIDYAPVDVKATQIMTDQMNTITFVVLAQRDDGLDEFWDEFLNQTAATAVSNTSTITYNANSVEFDVVDEEDCGYDASASEYTSEMESLFGWFGFDLGGSNVLCADIVENNRGPPAGGAVFFGKPNDDVILADDGKAVIGYAVADNSQIDDLLVVENCNMEAGEDYEMVQLTSFDDSDWEEMMEMFKPYFQQRTEQIKGGGFSDGCGDFLNPADVVVSSMPWVINYEKGIVESHFSSFNDYDDISYHLSSVPANEIRKRNIYEELMADTPGVSSCELRRTTLWGSSMSYLNEEEKKFYYNLLFTRYFYLFKYEQGSGHIGTCAVDDSTYFPEVKTFGWCEACTASTLAYQNITATDRVYMPGYYGKLEEDPATEVAEICSNRYAVSYEGGGNFDVDDNVSCFHPAIADIDAYQGSIGGIGSPRTIPEASVMKERMGNYMKAGVLPVLDMSDSSNWNKTNPDAGGSFTLIWWTVEYGAEDEYAEYDFERLIGDMGAAVVIVDHVDADNVDDRTDRSVARAGLVKTNCFGCLAAVHVDSPEDNESFDETISTLLASPSAKINIDMITFDYPVSEHDFDTAEEVADDLETYGRISLQTAGKPVMIVGLNVEDNDGTWSSSNYEELFREIVDNQNDLIKSGVTGIIYSPVRDNDLGIIDVSGGVGSKTDKFCALQGALERMSQNPPTAIFTRIPVLDNVTCIPCGSLAIAGDDTSCDRTCDNGVECDLPADVPESEGGTYKCPANTVVGECELCNETGGDYTCTIRYANGTTVETDPRPMTDIDSQVYLDIIGGIAKPDKCCLEDTAGTRYSYAKQAYSTAINKPIIFPRSGADDIDCGIGDIGDLSELASFCDIENVPIREFDIQCEIS